MPFHQDISFSNIPAMFKNITQLAGLPVQATYGMLLQNKTFNQVVQDEANQIPSMLDAGQEEQLLLADPIIDDPNVVDKAIYQINNPNAFMTPWGDALDPELLDPIIDQSPGIEAFIGLNDEQRDEVGQDADSIIDKFGGFLSDIWDGAQETAMAAGEDALNVGKTMLNNIIDMVDVDDVYAMIEDNVAVAEQPLMPFVAPVAVAQSNIGSSIPAIGKGLGGLSESLGPFVPGTSPGSEPLGPFDSAADGADIVTLPFVQDDADIPPSLEISPMPTPIEPLDTTPYVPGASPGADLMDTPDLWTGTGSWAYPAPPVLEPVDLDDLLVPGTVDGKDYGATKEEVLEAIEEYLGDPASGVGLVTTDHVLDWLDMQGWSPGDPRYHWDVDIKALVQNFMDAGQPEPSDGPESVAEVFIPGALPFGLAAYTPMETVVSPQEIGLSPGIASPLGGAIPPKGLGPPSAIGEPPSVPSGQPVGQRPGIGPPPDDVSLPTDGVSPTGLPGLSDSADIINAVLAGTELASGAWESGSLQNLRGVFAQTIGQMPGAGRYSIRRQMGTIFDDTLTLFQLFGGIKNLDEMKNYKDYWASNLRTLEQYREGLQESDPQRSQELQGPMSQAYRDFLQQYLQSPRKVRSGPILDAAVQEVGQMLSQYEEHVVRTGEKPTSMANDAMWVEATFGEGRGELAKIARRNLAKLYRTRGNRGYYSSQIHKVMDEQWNYMSNQGMSEANIFRLMTPLDPDRPKDPDSKPVEAVESSGQLQQEGNAFEEFLKL